MRNSTLRVFKEGASTLSSDLVFLQNLPIGSLSIGVGDWENVKNVALSHRNVPLKSVDRYMGMYISSARRFGHSGARQPCSGEGPYLPFDSIGRKHLMRLEPSPSRRQNKAIWA